MKKMISLKDLISYQVIPRKPLDIVSADDDSQHQYKLGQVSGIAGCVKNPTRLIVFHRGSREWNEQYCFFRH